LTYTSPFLKVNASLTKETTFSLFNKYQVNKNRKSKI